MAAFPPPDHKSLSQATTSPRSSQMKMNKEQEEQTCCAKCSRFMACIIHTSNIIATLAVCILSFALLGITLYLYVKVCEHSYFDGDEDVKAPAIMEAFLTLLYKKMHPTRLPKNWASLVNDLKDTEPPTIWYVFLFAMLSTGICALLSAIYSAMLLANHRQHYTCYLPVWVYSGKLFLDGALLYVQVRQRNREALRMGPWLVRSFCWLTGLFTITQLILHIFISVSMRGCGRVTKTDVCGRVTKTDVAHCILDMIEAAVRAS